MADTPSTPAFYPGALDVPDRLTGARIVLRPFVPADLDALRGAIEESRDHLLPWLPWAHDHKSPEETLEFINHQRAEWISRQGFGAGIFGREDGRTLGGAGLHVRGWPARVFEIGYWLRRSATGHGYTRDAVALLTHLAYTRLGANRVFIRCDARNDRSRRVAEASGFTFEGRLRRDGLADDGVSRDTLYFSMLREEYEARLPAWAEALGDVAL